MTNKINTGRLLAAKKEIRGAKEWLQKAEDALQAFQAEFQDATLYSEPGQALAAILDELKAAEEYRRRAVSELFQLTAPLDDQVEEVIE